MFAAHGTLSAGARFFAGLAGRETADDETADDETADNPTGNIAVRARTLGNQLHELEHLLGVLADEASPLIDWLHDAKAFSRLRNVPRKLRMLGEAIDFDSADYDRAQAIGRIQRKLRRGARPISHDGVCHPTAATPTRDGIGPFPLPAQAILSISDFYRDVGERLVTGVLRNQPSLTFPTALRI